MHKAIIYFMEVKATFNLREPNRDKPTNINLICRINGKQLKIGIGTEYNVYPKHWDKKTQTAKINPALEQIYVEHHTTVNNRIQECLKLFDEWKQYIADNTHLIYDSETLLRKYITGEKTNLENSPIDWFNHYIDTISTAKESSKLQYKRDIKVFERFIKEKKIQLNTFAQFTFEILKQYEIYLIEKAEKVATINNKISNLKILLNSAENYGHIDLKKNRITRHKKLKDELKYDNVIYLTEEEINTMYNLDLTEKQKIVRDIFVVQCYLGQRISDMANLGNAIIRENEIELYQKKTNTPVTIPILSPIVKEILSEYNNSFPEKIVNSTAILNYHLKEIAKAAGINEEITYREQKGTKIEIKKAVKWELVTTHTARRSFATNMLRKGYTKEVIMKLTGHKTDSAFRVYDNMTSQNASQFILEREGITKQLGRGKENDSKPKKEVNKPEEKIDRKKLKNQFITRLREQFNTKLKEAGINQDSNYIEAYIAFLFVRYDFTSEKRIIAGMEGIAESNALKDMDYIITRLSNSDNAFCDATFEEITNEIASQI